VFLSQQDYKISRQELDNKLQLLMLQQKIEKLERKIDRLSDKK
jgi:hypothetical protein